MLLCRHRRRISTRTKRRCRVLCRYLRRLFNIEKSQEKTNSKVSMVTKFKDQIDYVEQRLAQISKHCEDLIAIQNDVQRRISQSVMNTEHLLGDAEEIRQGEAKEIWEEVGQRTKLRVSDDKRFRKNPGRSSRSIGLNTDEASMIPQMTSVHMNSACGRSSTSRHGAGDKLNRDKDTVRDVFLVSEPGHSKDNKCDNRRYKTRSPKPDFNELDKDFIAEIIRKQYKPITLFDRSDYSEMSAPICRDHESVSEEAGNRLPKNGRQKVKHVQKITNNIYQSSQTDDTDYDLIPVKEKASPKSRRKFIEENSFPYNRCKEVPPCPFTRRPQLILEAQCLPDELIVAENPTPDFRSKSKAKSEVETSDTNDWIEEIRNSKTPADNIDKTEKTLREIKFILKKGLKEVAQNALQSKFTHETINSETSKAHTDRQACNNFDTFAPYTNPWYPIIPICTVNGVQNGFIVSNPTFPHPGHLKNDRLRSEKDKNEEMLNEIYNLLRTRKERRRSNDQKVGNESRGQKRPRVGLLKSSKSCEDVTSRTLTETSCRRSETVLERPNFDDKCTTVSATETCSTIYKKSKSSNLAQILRAIGILNNKTNSSDDTSGIRRPNEFSHRKNAATKKIRRNGHDQVLSASMQPVPLYLKEIEMQDVSSQTVRKTFFHKILKIAPQKFTCDNQNDFYRRNLVNLHECRENENNRCSLSPRNVVNSFIRRFSNTQN